MSYPYTIAAAKKVLDAALAWDEAPGDPDLCFELSEACGHYRRAQREDYQRGPDLDADEKT